MRRARFFPAGVLAIVADSLGREFEMHAAPATPFDTVGDFAVVSISGPLMQHAVEGWDSYQAIATRVAAALDSHLPAVMLKICSPGGQVAGCFELADEIRATASAKGKRVLAYVDGLAASAAYALACAAEKIFVPSTGLVGSIGTMQVAVDQTAADRLMGLGFEVFASGARKADGNPHVVMSDDARRSMQSAVDDMAATFFAAVGRARGVGPEKVAALEAALFVGAKAVAAGLADDVKTFAEVVSSGAQITAQTMGAEEEMDEEEKAKAALQAIADGDDEKAATRAKAALAAFADDGGDDDEKKEDKKDEAQSKTTAEASDDDKDDSDKKDDDAKAKASAAENPVMALAAQVQSLSAWKAEQVEAKERAKLMATRPDFAPEVVALMERSPIEVVRDAVKNLPRGAAKGQVNAARAALDVTPSVTPATATGSALPPEQEAAMLKSMGIKPVKAETPTVRADGSTLFPFVTPSQARERANAAKAEKGKA